jgi:hypothetical protein
LLVWVGGLTGFEVTVEVVLVAEGAGLVVLLCYGLVPEIGSSGRLCKLVWEHAGRVDDGGIAYMEVVDFFSGFLFPLPKTQDESPG